MTTLTYVELIQQADQADVDAEMHRRNNRHSAADRCEALSAALRVQADTQGPDPSDPTVSAVGLVTKDEMAAAFRTFAVAVDAMVDERIAAAFAPDSESDRESDAVPETNGPGPAVHDPARTGEPPVGESIPDPNPEPAPPADENAPDPEVETSDVDEPATTEGEGDTPPSDPTA